MSSTRNEISGAADGPVVQAGTVEGGVHITHITGDWVGGNVIHGDYVAGDVIHNDRTGDRPGKKNGKKNKKK